MITVVNYGAGNLRSVANTLEQLGASFEITQDPAAVDAARALILPGVGHFGQMMDALARLGLRDPLLRKARSGAPFLGICLGLQALFEASEEAPEQKGLGLFPGLVRRFPAGVRCPHMGWNTIQPLRPSPLLEGPGASAHYYFAHSYYCPDGPHAAALCSYGGVSFCALLAHGNVFGVQFHPEKSGPAGLALLRRFLSLAGEAVRG
ncbi:MAG: imidazole glycerol phosphate synthase subunit HisH [Bryobacteraceae bacterium]|nr:imidazole glycerol phosphate synthase subunit HisH [Bryobacteraceae bacterium]MCX7603552.1 imidazole glycerol phosphate synthase subunit HisH [Bryobacteraceae bacterium]